MELCIFFVIILNMFFYKNFVVNVNICSGHHNGSRSLVFSMLYQMKVNVQIRQIFKVFKCLFTKYVYLTINFNINYNNYLTYTCDKHFRSLSKHLHNSIYSSSENERLNVKLCIIFIVNIHFIVNIIASIGCIIMIF